MFRVIRGGFFGTDTFKCYFTRRSIISFAWLYSSISFIKIMLIKIVGVIASFVSIGESYSVTLDQCCIAPILENRTLPYSRAARGPKVEVENDRAPARGGDSGKKVE